MDLLEKKKVIRQEHVGADGQNWTLWNTYGQVGRTGHSNIGAAGQDWALWKTQGQVIRTGHFNLGAGGRKWALGKADGKHWALRKAQ